MTNENTPQTEEKAAVDLTRLVRRPIGSVPADVKAWLEANEEWTGWEIAVCDCGKWYHTMDHLAPYHTELNWCKKCGYQSPPNAEVSHSRPTASVDATKNL